MIALAPRKGDLFHQGWWARLLEQPDDESRPLAWREGWRTADETGETAWLACPAMLRLGQLVVREVQSRAAHANVTASEDGSRTRG